MLIRLVSPRRISLHSALFAAPLALVAGLALSGYALAGPVKGKIVGGDKLTPEVYVESARVDSHRWTWRESTAARPPSANLSREVCVAALGGAGGPLEPQTVRITGGRTVPTTLVVSPGTRVSFVNRDPFQHRLFIPGNAAWHADTTNANSSREWTAPIGEGRFEFRDELFPSVRTVIVVDPQVAKVTFPSSDGTFQFDNLPPGEYVLKVFFGGKALAQASVAVRDKAPIELRDVLNVAAAPAGGESK